MDSINNWKVFQGGTETLVDAEGIFRTIACFGGALAVANKKPCSNRDCYRALGKKVWQRPTLPRFTAVPSAQVAPIAIGVTSLLGMGRAACQVGLSPCFPIAPDGTETYEVYQAMFSCETG